MSRKSEANAGLLGKVVKFIKSPTTDWADLDRPESSGLHLGADTPQSRQALKALIERKRRNDFVRAREFDMLRKIRHKGAAGQGDAPDTMALASSYSSSQLAHDAEARDGAQKRQQTLRKIDEIEAQLSRGWFRKPGEAPTVPMRLGAAQALRQPSLSSQPVTPSGKRAAPTAASARVARSRLPEPPVLTQPYRPEVARAVAPVAPLSKSHKPSPAWDNDDLKGLAVQSGPGGIDLADFPAPVIPRSITPPPVPAPDRVTGRMAARRMKGGDSALEGLSVRSQPSALGDALGPFAPPGAAAGPSASSPAPRKPRRPASVYESNLGDLEVVARREDPEVEEAAISFANGDETTAELVLLRLVGTGGSRRGDVDVWLVLFDLYRVTGKADSFDGLVPEFTALFGRSAPQWERKGGENGGPEPSGKKTPRLQTTREGAFAWASPSQFDARALTALTGAAGRTAPPWRIDWRNLKTVDPEILPQLADLFTQWADAPTQLQFLGCEQLQAALAGPSAVGDKTADPAWWRARLALLRLMGEPDQFDQTALDYCITYEISPPAWVTPKSRYAPLAADGQSPESAGTDTGATGRASAADEADAPPTFALTTIAGELLSATGVFETSLEGEILGSADQALAAVPGNLERIQTIDFDCRALLRVDFGAAGDFLNWSIVQQGQGRTVTFRDVHRLLAAFLRVIGVDAVAQVVLRKD